MYQQQENHKFLSHFKKKFVIRRGRRGLTMNLGGYLLLFALTVSVKYREQFYCIPVRDCLQKTDTSSFQSAVLSSSETDCTE